MYHFAQSFSDDLNVTSEVVYVVLKSPNFILICRSAVNHDLYEIVSLRNPSHLMNTSVAKAQAVGADASINVLKLLLLCTNFHL